MVGWTAAHRAVAGNAQRPVVPRKMPAMTPRDLLELDSFVVTVVGLPFAIWQYLKQQRAERENEEEEAYLHLADAYNDFLKVVRA